MGITMGVAIVFLTVVGFYYFESMQEFSANSNHNPVYEFVRGIPCEPGLKPSGYSLVPTGKLYLKQVNHDGTVGDVCRLQD